MNEIVNNKEVQEKYRIHLISLQQNINFEVCHQSKSIKSIISQFGTNTTGKLLAAAITHFSLSLNLSRNLEAVEIIECAQLIMENWAYESFADILFALKRTKLGGHVFYGGVGINEIMGILNKYFDDKINWHENQRYIAKQTEDSKGFFDILSNKATGNENRQEIARKYLSKLRKHNFPASN